MGYTVNLHVYDLGAGQLAGVGAFHSAVEINGNEWSYGGTQGDGTGVFPSEPRGCTMHRENTRIPPPQHHFRRRLSQITVRAGYKESVKIGETAMEPKDVDALVQQYVSSFGHLPAHLQISRDDSGRVLAFFRMSEEWPGAQYDLLHKNCCHFADGELSGCIPCTHAPVHVFQGRFKRDSKFRLGLSLTKRNATLSGTFI